MVLTPQGDMDVVALAARLLGPKGEWGAAVATELAPSVAIGRVLVHTPDCAGGLIREVGNGRRVEPVQGDTNVRREETGLGEAWGGVSAGWSAWCPCRSSLR